MHRLRTHPPCLGRKPAHPIQKLLQTRANGIVDIERNKNPHRTRQSSVVSLQKEHVGTAAAALLTIED